MKRPLPSCNNQSVKVYRNLNNKCLSVMEKGRVTGHAIEIVLADVEFKVSQKGRDRCLQEKRKNVHAFAVGSLVRASETQSQMEGSNLIPISYNPYKAGYFYRKDTGAKIERAGQVTIKVDGIWAIDVE